MAASLKLRGRKAGGEPGIGMELKGAIRSTRPVQRASLFFLPREYVLTFLLHRDLHALSVALVLAPVPSVRVAGELEQGGREGGFEGGRRGEGCTSTSECSCGLNRSYATPSVESKSLGQSRSRRPSSFASPSFPPPLPQAHQPSP